MGIVVAGFTRTISIHSRTMDNYYAASQAYWSSVAGMEVGLVQSIGGVYGNLDTFDFYNSTVIVDTADTYEDGSPLPSDYWTRVNSRGFVDDAERRLRFLAVLSMKSVWGDVSIIDGTANMKIKSGFTLYDSVYIGQNLTINSGATLGALGDTAHIYRAPSNTITISGSYPYLTTGTHWRGAIFNPHFDTTPYDSLIDIAKAITSTSGNKFKGKQRWRRTTLDLSGYTDRTIYVKGKIDLQGATVTGGTDSIPGVIVASDKIKMESRKGTETSVDDNIIVVTDKDIKILDYTTFGLDHSALAPENRPITLNEAFAKDDLTIDKHTVAWGHFYCRDDIKVHGTAYGICYAPDKFTFSKSTSYIEGAVFATKFIGSAGVNQLDVGVMDLNYIFHEEYFKTYLKGLKQYTLNEY